MVYCHERGHGPREAGGGPGRRDEQEHAGDGERGAGRRGQRPRDGGQLGGPHWCAVSTIGAGGKGRPPSRRREHDRRSEKARPALRDKKTHGRTRPDLRGVPEVGPERTFASALDWPGWCRSGQDEDAALQALVEYGPRYAKVVRPRRFGFTAPKDVGRLRVTQRVTGDASTEFGVPGAIPTADRGRIGKAEAGRASRILEACWVALDGAADSARGPLAKGPGGRAHPRQDPGPCRGGRRLVPEGARPPRGRRSRGEGPGGDPRRPGGDGGP